VVSIFVLCSNATRRWHLESSPTVVCLFRGAGLNRVESYRVRGKDACPGGNPHLDLGSNRALHSGSRGGKQITERAWCICPNNRKFRAGRIFVFLSWLCGILTPAGRGSEGDARALVGACTTHRHLARAWGWVRRDQPIAPCRSLRPVVIALGVTWRTITKPCYASCAA